MEDATTEDAEVWRAMDAKKTEVARKRRRVDGYDTLEATCKFIKHESQIRDLYDPHKVSIVPYMGTLHPGTRPGKAINFVGSQDLPRLLAEWIQLEPGCQLLLVGPKGTGKTCLLRAFANFLCAAAPECSITVCIWNTDLATDALCKWLLDALMFAYKCAKHGKYDAALARIEHMLGRLKADNSWEKTVEQEILHEIQLFLLDMTQAGEIFTFIIDGAQALDTRHHDGQEREAAQGRQQMFLKLKDIVRPYKVIWGLSPMASFARAMVSNDTSATSNFVLFRVQGFTQEQRQSFLEYSALGAVVEASEQRKNDMDFYAGFHPHFLDALDHACIKAASEKLQPQQDMFIWSTDMSMVIGLNERNLSPREVAAILEDEEDWARVLHIFIANPPMSSIRKSVASLQIKHNNEALNIEQMIAEDPRYAIDESNFCSDFVKQIYMEEFRKKVPSAGGYGPWLSYAKVVLQSPHKNWSEVGWLCERLCDDVISQRGMRISSTLIVNRISPQPFSSVPKPKDIPMHTLMAGFGLMYIPIRFNFGKVDAVIFYRNMNGQLHLIGLQFTTSQSKHQHSKDEFMAVNVLKQWVPDVVQLQRERKIVLDFVFVCTASEPEEKEQKGTYKELRNGASVGTVDHISHVIGFDYALEGRASDDVLNTLKDMASFREQKFINLDGTAEPIAPQDISKGIVLSKADASKLKRAELDAYAIHVGIAPHIHPTRKSLLDALIGTGVVVLRSQ